MGNMKSGWMCRSMGIPAFAGLALFAFTMTGTSTAFAQKNIEVGKSCSTAAEPFSGRTLKTENENKQLYMMLSAYHLAPYDVAYVENTLAELGRMNVAGIVYSTAGELTRFFARKKKTRRLSEDSYNEKLFRRARKHKADIWLQMRVYGNQIRHGRGQRNKNLTAEQILESRPARQAFMDRFKADFKLYNNYFANSCKVVLFEEAGIYHSVQGGGRFWSSKNKRVKRSPRWDEIYASRMAKIFRLTRNSIKKINPDCQVGMHQGHSVFLNQPVLGKWIDWLKDKDAAPDFMFYDFYLKAQRNWKKYKDKLTRRKNFITNQLNLPALHLAQLHTMNNFQHGGGRSPSKKELDAMIALDDRLGFDGVGFYTKNARKTANLKNNPFAPNRHAQSTVYESSKDRWDYGMLKLLEKNGINYRNRFDLVLHGRFTNDAYIVYLKNAKTGKYDFIGYVNPLRKKHFKKRDVLVFRSLDRRKYLSDGNWLDVQISRAGHFKKGYLQGLYVIPSEPPETFRTAKSLKRQIRRRGSVSGAAGGGRVRLKLNRKSSRLSLCVQSR